MNKEVQNNHVCRLCDASSSELFHQDKNRPYYRCATCGLVYAPSSYFLSADEEKQRYDLHINSPDDQGYRRFLHRLFDPLTSLIPKGSKGLDFGSGPGPTLSLMFEESGYSMTLYDYFYAPDSSALNTHYDFITATEVLEHLHNPGTELNRLWSCLKNDGTLGIMTKLVKDQKAFAKWHYIRDLTHVCFFSRMTFEWLANHLDAGLDFIGNDVIILLKK